MIKKKFGYLLLVIALVLPLTSALQVGTSGSIGLDLSPTITTVSFNNATVNSSNLWITTTLGVLSDANTTQFSNNAGTLSVDEAFLNSLHAWNRSGTDVFLANTGDNVGIGTDTPEVKLEVAGGNIKIDNGYYIKATQYTTGDSINLMGVPSTADYIVLGGGDSAGMKVHFRNGYAFEPFVDSSYTLGRNTRKWKELWISGNSYIDGNVGIGTDAPQRKLEVNGTANITEDLYVGDDLFVTDRVGIGTTSPDRPLHVIGTSIFTDTVYYGGNTYYNDYHGSNLYSIGFNRATGTNYAYPDIHGVTTGLVIGGLSNGTGSIALNTIGSNTAPSMYIQATTGNVGIGTTSPQNKLSIANDTHEDTDGGRESALSFQGQQSGGEETTLAKIEASHDGTADDEKGKMVFSTNDGTDGDTPTLAMTIDENQRVGIGTDSPIRKFHLFDNGVNNDARLYIEATPGNNGPGIEFAYDNTASIRSLIRMELAGTNGTEFSFWTKPDGFGLDEVMRLHDSGGLSLGKNYVATDPGANMIVEGNVGIGTATPTQKLEVNGTANITEDLYVGDDLEVGDTLTVKSDDGTDRINIWHDNSNAYMNWDDGDLNLQTDEGINADTIVNFRGKGTGRARLRTYDQDDAEYIEFTASNGIGTFQVDGPSPVAMNIQPAANIDVRLFNDAQEGEVPEFRISGFRTGDIKRSLQIGVGVDANDTASFDGVGNYLFDGAGIFSSLGSAISRIAKGWFVDLDVSGNVSIGGDLNVSGDIVTLSNLNVEGNFSAKRAYAMVSSNLSQVATVANTVYTVNFTHLEDEHLMDLEGMQNITFQDSGDYLVSVSAIIVTDTNNKHFNMFPQIHNGTAWNNVPRGNTRLEIENAGTEAIIAVTFMLDIEEGEKFRLMYASDDAGSMTVWTDGSGAGADAIPETPSIIMTVAKHSEITVD